MKDPYVFFTFAGPVASAVATFFVVRKQARRDQNSDYLMVIQALEVNNRLLDSELKKSKTELERITTHRDYLLAEQAAFLKAFLELKKNGNGHGGKESG